MHPHFVLHYFSATVLFSTPLLISPVSLPAIAQTQPSPSTPLLRIEGALEDGGTRLTEDDTLYATHEFEGQAGQTVTIVMESLEFDTYLFLSDPQEEIIAQNDDYTESNFNSVITIELPADGTYTIIANAYNAQQNGQYTLTVLPGEEPVFSDLALRQVEARLLNQQGLRQDNAGEYQAALDSYGQALDIYRDIGDRNGEGTVLNNIGLVYDNLGDYDMALDYYGQAIAIRQEIGDRYGEGVTFNNVGTVYRSLGEYSTALDFFNQALPVFQEIGDRRREGTALNNIGLVYDDLGEYDTALDYYEQALAIQQEIGDRSNEEITLNNIGGVYDSLGQYEQALTFYERSLVITQEIGDRPSESISLNNIGSLYANLGEYDTALDYYEQALSIFQEIGDRRGEGITLNNIGGIYDKLGEYDAALDYYEQALTIRQEIGDRRGEGISLNNIGGVYDKLGEYHTALDYCEQALAIQKEIGDRRGEGKILSNIGHIYDNLGENSTALGYYEQSLTILQEVGDRAGIAITLHNMGYAIEALDEPELAIVFLKASVNQWEEIRGNIRGLDIQQQQSFTDSISKSYRKLADLLLQNDRILEAQRVLDLLKVQELDEYLDNVRGTAQTESGVELLDPEREINNRAIAVGYELAQLRSIPFAELTDEQKQRIADLQAEQNQIGDDFQAFIDSPEIQSLIQQLSTDAQTQDVLARMDEFKNLQNNLQQLPNAVMIYPLILDDRLELVVVTPFGEPTRYPVEVERDELNQAIVDFRQALTTRDRNRDPKPAAQRLYDLLIAPMAADLEAIGAETILYAPDGVLRYIPLAALHDGDQWLVERFRINNITAASLQDFTLQPDPQLQILAAAFSEGQFDFNVGERSFSYGGLPYAGLEVENLVAAFPSTTSFFNTDFTLDNTELAMDSHTIVHLATHAAFVQGSPKDSFILLGNGDRLTLEYIKQNWDGKFNRVDLVVLSACETGLGDITQGNGEEILGFGYLMQEAGAEAAIASLWSVDDGGTQLLMNAFYSALNQGMSKAEALRQAQIALITGEFSTVGMSAADVRGLALESTEPQDNGITHNHPYYWAPFILIGNGL